jgi:hypothetical protein
VILRSIGISLFLICLTFSAFAAEGEMGTGSVSVNSVPPNTANIIEIEIDGTTTTVETENDFLGWIAAIFADVLS